VAGAYNVSRLGRLRGRGVGDFDWSGFSTTLINDAASVASIAVRPAAPPTYQSSFNPYTGASSITAYGPYGTSMIPGSSGPGGPGLSASGSLSGTSELLLLGGLGIVLLLIMRRR
jgi:hypothetical protein